MALATLTARVDESDKSAFDSFCNSVGLTASAAINMYVKAVLRERRIPFEIKQDDPFYSASNQTYIMKSVAELKAGKGTVHELIEVNDEWKNLVWMTHGIITCTGRCRIKKQSNVPTSLSKISNIMGRFPALVSQRLYTRAIK